MNDFGSPVNLDWEQIEIYPIIVQSTIHLRSPLVNQIFAYEEPVGLLRD